MKGWRHHAIRWNQDQWSMKRLENRGDEWHKLSEEDKYMDAAQRNKAMRIIRIGGTGRNGQVNEYGYAYRKMF